MEGPALNGATKGLKLVLRLSVWGPQPQARARVREGPIQSQIRANVGADACSRRQLAVDSDVVVPSKRSSSTRAYRVDHFSLLVEMNLELLGKPGAVQRLPSQPHCSARLQLT